MKHKNLNRVSTVGIATILVVTTALLTSCGGNDGDTQNSESPKNIGAELTDARIAEILPSFDFEGLELESTQRDFYVERSDETLPLLISYQGSLTADTPRQCLGGQNPISQSFEKTLLDNGWTIDSLLTGDYSDTLTFQNSIRSVEVFRKSDYVVSITCDIQVQDVEELEGSAPVVRNCIVNNGPEVTIILSYNSVPKSTMAMAYGSMSWTKTSLTEIDPIFLDDAWRLDRTREYSSSEPILDFEGIPYPYRGEYPKTPSDTNHGPIRACRYDEQRSKWIIPD